MTGAEGGTTAARGGRQWRTAAVVVFALIAGTALNRLTPDPARQQEPFLLSAPTNVPVEARTFRVTAVRSLAGPELVGDEFGGGPPVLDTSGVWVLVRVRAEGLREPARIGYAALVDQQGRTFRSSSRADQDLVDRPLQPQLEVEGEIVFEIPADAVGPMQLRLSPAGSDLRLDAVTDISLTVAPPVDGLLPLRPMDTRLVRP